MTRRLIATVMALLVLGVAWAAAVEFKSLLPLVIRDSSLPVIQGVVVDANGPVSGATVRVQSTTNLTLSNEDGRFALSNLAAGVPVTVTAWNDGYFVGWTHSAPGPEPVTITLSPYYTTDNPEYDWFSLEGADGSLSCSHCMPSYDEWIDDAHAQSAVNERFLTMYSGTDVHGNQSPETRYACSRDYGCFPLRPDPSQPYYGPGYKLDFPTTAGNCATCHVPAQAAKSAGAYAADPNVATGIELEGVFCEFCHKIGDVTLDPVTGLPYPNMPGVLSLRLYRPDADQQLFFAQFDDVTRRVSRLPLMKESAYCAPCHSAEFWGVSIYNSFGEWLDSPYSDPQTGQTCQDCHMAPVDYDYFVYPEKGGLIRDPNHHVPTDCPLRHLILRVEATDELGRILPQLDGPALPEWCGLGDPADGYYAGMPGRAFAKVLQEQWTEISPTGAYWNMTRILSDNRIAAFATDSSTYTFTAPEEGKATVEVTLVFRRAFIELMDQKDWSSPDIVMEQIMIRGIGVQAVRTD